MKKLWKWLFGLQNNKSSKHTEIKSITCGERGEDGFCDTYVNGEKTNVRLLVFDKEEINRLHRIADEIHKNNKN